MRAASSGLLVPAMGFAVGEGAGDAVGTEGVEWGGSGDGEAPAVRTDGLDVGHEAAAVDAVMTGKTETRRTREQKKKIYKGPDWTGLQ